MRSRRIVVRVLFILATGLFGHGCDHGIDASNADDLGVASSELRVGPGLGDPGLEPVREIEETDDEDGDVAQAVSCSGWNCHSVDWIGGNARRELLESGRCAGRVWCRVIVEGVETCSCIAR